MKQRNLLALMMLAFVLGTYEFVVVGILPEIAAGLGVSLSAVGKLVSAFAGAYAVGTPFITAATGRFPRFRVLVVEMLLFMATCVLSMTAPNVAVLYVSQMLAALVSGPLTAVLMLFARDMAEEGRIARALAMMYAGFSLAAVVGVPLGTSVCRMFGWRWTYAMILVMAAVLLPILARVLPRPAGLPAAESGFLHQFSVLRDRRCLLCAGTIFFSGTATYTLYTYLTPILTDVLGVTAAMVSPLLLIVGLCNMASNLFSGWLGERGGVKRLPVVYGLQAVLYGLMPLLLGNLWTGLGAVLVMAALMYVLNTPTQAYALELAEREYPFAATLCASMLSVCYNFGIAVGSFTGSSLQPVVGFKALGAPAAVFALVGLALNLRLLKADRAGAVAWGAEKAALE